MLATGRPTDTDVLLRFGARGPAAGESDWWRWLSSMFVHIGPLHLIFNMLWLYVLGASTEERFGPVPYLGLYLCSGLAGSAVSEGIAHSFGVSAGASGAVFGILGAWAAVYLQHARDPAASSQLRSILVLIGLSLVWGLSVPRVDNAAHIGGAVGGFVIASPLEAARGRPGLGPRLAGLAGFALAAAGSLALIETSAAG